MRQGPHTHTSQYYAALETSKTRHLPVRSLSFMAIDATLKLFQTVSKLMQFKCSLNGRDAGTEIKFKFRCIKFSRGAYDTYSSASSRVFTSCRTWVSICGMKTTSSHLHPVLSVQESFYFGPFKIFQNHVFLIAYSYDIAND